MNRKTITQLIWGILLLGAGIGVFIRIPQVMPRIAEIASFQPMIPFVRVGFYMMGIILVGGGIKKIHAYITGPAD